MDRQVEQKGVETQAQKILRGQISRSIEYMLEPHQVKAWTKKSNLTTIRLFSRALQFLKESNSQEHVQKVEEVLEKMIDSF